MLTGIRLFRSASKRWFMCRTLNVLMLFAVGLSACCSRHEAHSSGASVPVSAATIAPATSPTTQNLGRLTIHVTGLRNHKGQLIVGVFTSANGFPKDPRQAVSWQVKPADADTITFTAVLPPGVYGASVLHDENSNNKMDLNALGIPLEGYGETNNPKPQFRAATFDESRFTLPPEGREMTISLQYF